jgi:hypothetical protein
MRYVPIIVLLGMPGLSKALQRPVQRLLVNSNGKVALQGIDWTGPELIWDAHLSPLALL